MLWQFGFRHYVVTNETEAWQLDIEENPKYRSLFEGKPAPEEP
jgi:hypothetical protein